MVTVPRLGHPGAGERRGMAEAAGRAAMTEVGASGTGSEPAARLSSLTAGPGQQLFTDQC